MPTRLSPLPLLLLLTAGCAAAQSAAPPPTDADTEHSGSLPAVDRRAQTELSVVTVRGAAPSRDAVRNVTPASVLSGTDLDEARASTLGQTVANLPGVQTTAFGQAAGRPVIRGLDGPRVAVLSDGLGAGDVSAISQDHAVGIEPFLADRIEVLKGPATLLYGSGAIGGVVNVSDGRIAQQAPDAGFSGRVQAGYDSVSRGQTELFRVDAGSAGFVLHADGMNRRDGDYAIPGSRLPNSHVDTNAGALGGSWLGAWGYAGLSVSRYLDSYGNPAEPGDAAHGVAAVHLQLQQTRYDLKGALNAPLPGIDRIEYALGRTDYHHTEYEGDAPATRFSNLSDEARVLFMPTPLAGWQGSIGLQALQRDFAALGEETFVPPTTTRGLGLFAVASHAFAALDLELGARLDHRSSRPRDSTRRSFAPHSLSAGLTWRIDDAWHLTLNLDRAQRAPAEEELFAHGPHAASATFEIGNALLGEETANQAELGLHFHGQLVDAKLAIWTNRYADFIYLADTGLIEDGLPVRHWSQRDALLRGGEAEATFHLAATAVGHYDLRLWGDTVRATLAAHGGNVPRIPAARAGGELKWHNDDWRASLGVTRYFAHDDVAAMETRTAGFTLVGAHLAWAFASTPRTSWEAFVDADNLANQTARLSTSLIKDSVPLPGRSLTLGLRGLF